jgi:DNA topoisomerase IB
VCRKYYVHPELIAAYHLGLTVPATAAATAATATRPRPQRPERPEAALRRDEVAVLQFLQARLPD